MAPGDIHDDAAEYLCTESMNYAPEILRKLALWNRVCQIHGSAWHVRQSDLDEIWAGLSQWHRAETVTARRGSKAAVAV